MDGEKGKALDWEVALQSKVPAQVGNARLSQRCESMVAMIKLVHEASQAVRMMHPRDAGGAFLLERTLCSALTRTLVAAAGSSVDAQVLMELHLEDANRGF